MELFLTRGLTMYRDQIEGRKCRACHAPLPVKWSQAICQACLSGPFFHWKQELDQRLFTFERIDMFRDQPRKMDMRGIIG
jgi:hypothetical protein